MKNFIIASLTLIILICCQCTSREEKAAQKERSRIRMTYIQIEQLSSALESYFQENKTYPSSKQGLKALVLKPTDAPVPKKWDGPYLSYVQILIDPWGTQYAYYYPSKVKKGHYLIISRGRDCKRGGKGFDRDLRVYRK